MAAVLGLAAGLTLLTAGPSLAHEVRRVGAYQFIVGFGDVNDHAFVTDPAFAVVIAVDALRDGCVGPNR